MKDKLKAISSELKKASKTHAGQAAKIDKLIKPKLSKLNKVNRMKNPKLSKKVKGYDGKAKYTKKQVDQMSTLDKNRYLKGINRGGRSGSYKGIKVPRVGKQI